MQILVVTSSMYSLFTGQVSVHTIPMGMIQGCLLLVQSQLLSLLLRTELMLLLLLGTSTASSSSARGLGAGA